MRKIIPTRTKSEKCSEEIEVNMDEMMSLMEDASDYDYREIVIEGEIDQTCLAKYTLPIIRINKIDDEQNIPIEDRQPIKLYISCVGGDILSGMNLCNIIKASKTPIIAIVFYAYSMGGLIAMACDEVYCYENSSFLIHDGAMAFSNSSGKVKDAYEFFTTKVESMVKDFILENTRISKKTLERNWHRDWYITAEESVELGIADEIIDEII